MKTYGLVEAGGTKFVLGIAELGAAAPSPWGGRLVARHRIATTTPAGTLDAAIAWFAGQRQTLAAIGIAAFGPLDLDRASPGWGRITETVKPHWSHTDLVTPFAARFGCPVGIDTDVNGAALAEAQWGAGAALAEARRAVLYLTVGTGIGGGFVAGGRLLHGAAHPEMGHIGMTRHPDDGDFTSVCRFHRDCLEGLASGPAIIARWGRSLSDLPADHPGHAMIGWYLGAAVASFQAMLAPARIVLGGGVMATPGLIVRVRREAGAAGGGYFVGDPQEIVVAPGLGTDSGLLGALAVALKSAPDGRGSGPASG